MALYVQYGCGLSCPVGWINFDASPTLCLQRLPIVGALFRRGRTVFPSGVQYGDIVAGLPIKNGTVDGAYASHVLEHLPYAEFSTALKNTFLMLKPGGVFRLIVPDLEVRARCYLSQLSRGDVDASSWFMRSTILGTETRARGITDFARAAIGNSKHLWMWDEASLTHELGRVGFQQIRRCQFNDSNDHAFKAVEDFNRFHDDAGFDECAMEGRKP